MQRTFKRYENKYLLDEPQLRALQLQLAERMQPDQYCSQGESYPIHSIYYDTASHDLIRQSLAKPYYKQKLRLRSYTFPIGPDDQVFLELKKKIGGIVCKRRVAMTLREAQEFVQSGRRPTFADYLNRQVTAEIAQLLTRQAVEPKVRISYRRMAFFSKDDREFRLTVDSEIRAERDNLFADSATSGGRLLPAGQYLLEVKISNALPLWFSRVLSGLNLYSTSFSKYGREYERYLLRQPQPFVPANRVPASAPTALFRPHYSTY